MIKAIRFEKTGGSDVLQYVDYDLPPPAKGQVQVRHTAIGVNFIDTYHRTGLYRAALAVGPGLGSGRRPSPRWARASPALKLGDRVGYSSGAIGSYAEANNVAGATKLVKLPDGINDETAAAILLKGMTAQYLLRQIHRVKAGETIVFHAAAGGVGQIACQWANHLGATVIGIDHLARKGRAGQAPMAAPMWSTPMMRAGKNRCASSPAARACRWSMIPSARTRSWRAWIVFSRAASW